MLERGGFSENGGVMCDCKDLTVENLLFGKKEGLGRRLPW